MGRWCAGFHMALLYSFRAIPTVPTGTGGPSSTSWPWSQRPPATTWGGLLPPPANYSLAKGGKPAVMCWGRPGIYPTAVPMGLLWGRSWGARWGCITDFSDHEKCSASLEVLGKCVLLKRRAGLHPAHAFLDRPWLTPLRALSCCCGDAAHSRRTENSCSFHVAQLTRFIPCRGGLLPLRKMHPHSAPLAAGMGVDVGCGAWPPATTHARVKHLSSRVIQSGLVPPPATSLLLYFPLLRTRRKTGCKRQLWSYWVSHCLAYDGASLMAI